MYPHFIEVSRSFEDENWKCAVNIDHIVFIEDHTIMPTITDEDEHNIIWVNETYDELKKLIEDAGALINKGDTRIDTQRRLTMQDLQGMVGEPVWSSNTNTWLLVYDGDWTYSGDPDRVCVRVVNRYGCKDIWLSEEDLIAKPLYRMKEG